jgi:hypothetical protein
MARTRVKKGKAARPRKKAPASPPLDPLRVGMPALDSITGVDEFKKGKKVFRIIHTNEVDEYELPPPAKVKRKKR